MTEQPIYIVAESAVYLPPDERQAEPRERLADGWAPQVALLLPALPDTERHLYAQYCDEVLAHLVRSPDAAGIVLIGEQAWDSQSNPSDYAVLELLGDVYELGYAGTVIYLTDLHITTEAKAPFLAAYPGLKIVRKTAVTQHHQPLPL